MMREEVRTWWMQQNRGRTMTDWHNADYSAQALDLFANAVDFLSVKTNAPLDSYSIMEFLYNAWRGHVERHETAMRNRPVITYDITTDGITVDSDN